MRATSVLATAILLAPHLRHAWSTPVSRNSGRSDVISISSTSTTHSAGGGGDTVVNQPVRGQPSHRAEVLNRLGTSSLMRNLHHHQQMANYRGPILSQTRQSSLTIRKPMERAAFRKYWNSLSPEFKARIFHRVTQTPRIQGISPSTIEALRALKEREAGSSGVRPTQVAPIRPTAVKAKIGQISKKIETQDKGKALNKEDLPWNLRPHPYVFPSRLYPAGTKAPEPSILDTSVKVVHGESQAGPSSVPPKATKKELPRLGHARFRKAPAGQAHPQKSDSSYSSPSSSSDSSEAPRTLDFLQ